MSIEFFEGWETVGTELGLVNEATTRPRMQLRWDAVNGGGIPSTDSMFLITDAFSEGFAVNMGTNGAFSSGNYFRWNVPSAKQEPPGASSREWIIGIRVHIPSNSRTWNLMVTHGLFGVTNDTSVLRIQIENSANINVIRENPGTFEIANADGVLIPGQWQYIEFRFKVAEQVDGGEIEVQLDGKTIIATTAADTNNALTTAFTHVFFNNVNIGTADPGDFIGYDDVVIIDKSESPHTDFLGPVRARSLPPNSDVSALWEPFPSGGGNYVRVDENGADAGDYVETDINATTDRYGVTDPLLPDEIVAVKVEAEAINLTGGTPSLHLEVASGTAVESTEHAITSTTAYDLFDMYVQEDPQGGAWTVVDIENMQSGYRFTNNLS